ncbi:hypothetical protein [Ruminococcus sp. 210702-SL.1.03]|nr:hypothetical protein [Ruminococcus sp. 210702-SL.1.03]MCB6616111.1 hypothetical protein [Ruminococcus sp. 210702-SL.1.03]
MYTGIQTSPAYADVVFSVSYQRFRESGAGFITSGLIFMRSAKGLPVR